MCGIFGIVSPGLTDSRIIKDSLNSLRHRGPDDEGYLFVNTKNGTYLSASGPDTCTGLKDGLRDISGVDMRDYSLVLANRRLSVIDLSQNGHQPMNYQNHNLWITYNGEIFNYKEIKAELKSLGYIFHSSTDTEVILASYMEWGENCVQKFNGQWAFCIYDIRKKKLFCSRDRFGIKPFYYWHNGRTFVFASEIKALLTLPFVKKEINKQLLFELIFFHSHHFSEESGYKNIFQLVPSHNLTIHLPEMEKHVYRYFELPYNEELGTYSHKKALTYADDIRDLLIDAVKVRLVSDVPLGSCLSGGLDSSSIVVIVNRLLKERGISADKIGEKQKTFTATFDDPSLDERIHADAVIRHTDVESFFVNPSAEKLWKEIDDFLFYQDGLCISTNRYAGWNVMRLASKHVRVVLNGQGGDELFGGYLRYEPVYLADLIKNSRFTDLFRFFVSKVRHYGLKYYGKSMVTGSYLAFIPDPLKIFLFRQRNKEHLKAVRMLIGETGFPNSLESMTDRIRSLSYLLFYDETVGYLHQLLQEDDRNASAFSIENRVPFVDHRLVEYVNTIPSIYKMYGGWSKWLLRLAMKGLLPERILWRKDKIGFFTPVSKWIRHKDSPIPALMRSFGITESGRYPHFLWKFYVSERLMNKQV
jgi:asparagine synthase (glutamine-hydrolysing)